MQMEWVRDVLVQGIVMQEMGTCMPMAICVCVPHGLWLPCMQASIHCMQVT